MNYPSYFVLLLLAVTIWGVFGKGAWRQSRLAGGIE